MIFFTGLPGVGPRRNGGAAGTSHRTVAAVFVLVLSLAIARDATPAALCGRHLANDLTFSIPGRGLALSWAPAGSAVNGGHAIAVGGHLIGSQTYLAGGERYDTKLYDTTTGRYLKRFGAHYWWAVSNAWAMNPFVGEVIADGAGDHAAKIFLADHPGTNLGALQSASVRGRYAVEDGALPGVKAVYGKSAPGMDDINAWILSLAFSPDGAWLAGASKDGSIRIWQITDRVHPEDQFKVVKVVYDPALVQALSVRWSPDGRSFAVGGKDGSARVYDFDPVHDRWDPATIAEFATVSFTAELGWLNSHATATTTTGAPVVADVARWKRTGLGTVWNVRWTPDGGWLLAAGDDVSTAFDVIAGTEQRLGGEGHGLDVSTDGTLVALGGGDARVRIFARFGAGFVPFDVLVGHTESVVGAVAWSPDGTTLATVAGGPLLGGSAFNQSVEGGDDHVRLWTFRESTGDPCGNTTTTTAPASTTTSTTLAGGTTTTTVGKSTTTTTTVTKGTTTTTSGASTTTTPTASTTSTTLVDVPPGAYPGFGWQTTGGAGHPTFVVTNSNDTGAGSLRDALARAGKAGGGIVTFALTDGGDLHPDTGLEVPSNVTIDATGSHVTLWGGQEGYGNGLLNVWQSNVIVKGLRVRNALNDGIQIEPKSGKVDVDRVVIDGCSFTGNSDGAVDVAGHNKHAVRNVTIVGNLIAGTGRHCSKGLCGGGSLFKYGATNGSYYANRFFANLDRDPLVSGSGAAAPPVVADLRWNVAEWTQSSSMSIRTRAVANVFGNWFFGPQDGARVWSGGQAWFGGGNVNQDPNPTRELAAPLPVPALPGAWALSDVLDHAGARPRDGIDACYLAVAQPSFSHFKSAATACDAVTP